MISNKQKSIKEKYIYKLIENSNDNLLIVGKKSYNKNSLFEKIINKYKSKITIIKINDDMPLFKTINSISIKFKKRKVDNILAIGGGTVIDSSKLLKFFLVSKSLNFKKIKFFMNKRINNKINLPKLIVVPTTAGSGAESTNFCVSYYYKKKISIMHKAILPNYYYLNSDFLYTNHFNNKLSSGLDTLTQCIESIISVNSSNKSIDYAFKGIDLVLNNFKNYLYINDKKSANNMQLASNLSGKAINISKTTAPHAFSYYLTSYHKISHGYAVGFLIPFFIKFLRDKIDFFTSNKSKKNFIILNLKLSKYYKQNEFFNNFYREIGYLNKFKKTQKLKINNKIYIKNINIERLKNFPIKMNNSDIKNMVSSIFKI